MAPAGDAASKRPKRLAPARARASGASDPVGPEEKDRIRVLMARGISCVQIARQLGRSTETISRHAKAMGLSFDREQTREATTVRVDDMKARRARLTERLLDEAEADLNGRKELQPDHAFLQKGEAMDGQFMPRPQDKMYLARSAATLLAEHRNLASFDSEDGAAGAKSMLAALAAGLATAAELLSAPEADE
jgi:hypothetical protein